MKYETNDIVLYGADGICCITEITERKIGTQTHRYYILKPVCDQKSTIMVPIANTALVDKMKRVPSEDELRLALNTAAEADTSCLTDGGSCREKFNTAAYDGNVAGLLCIMKYLVCHRQHRSETGKKLHAADERVLKDTERILFDEFSYILGIDRDNAEAVVRQAIS